MQEVAPHLFGIVVPSCWRSQMAERMSKGVNGRGERVSKEADTPSRIPTAAEFGIAEGN